MRLAPSHSKCVAVGVELNGSELKNVFRGRSFLVLT